MNDMINERDKEFANEFSHFKWDGDGFLLYQKRLERGTFELPFFDPQSKQCKMPYKTLSAIMSGICLKSMRYRKRLNL